MGERKKKAARYKILVVDDEPEIVKILEMFLAKSGFEVITALGGEKGLEALHSGIKPNLMILDMKMPKVRGIDVLKEMKSLNKEWPVIILSGSIDTKKHDEELKNLGCDQSEYFIKPVDLKILLGAVKKALGPNIEKNRC